jgi:hypothetical protein
MGRILEVLDSISRNVNLQTDTNMTFRGENMLVDTFELSSMSSATIGIQIEDDNDQTLTESTVQTLMSYINVTIATINAAIILPVDFLKSECFKYHYYFVYFIVIKHIIRNSGHFIYISTSVTLSKYRQ